MITPVAVIVRLLLAVILGGLIGFEREVHRRSAGLRTHILVSMGRYGVNQIINFIDRSLKFLNCILLLGQLLSVFP